MTIVGEVHVVGAGVAGLACAVRLSRMGRRVTVYEAAGHAGGRCRSFRDALLDRVIDNGNHLLLSGNRAVLSYLREIGAADSLAGPERAEFHFMDLESGQRWTLRPNAGPIPWWIFSPRRRVPGSRARDYLEGAWLVRAGKGATVAACLDTSRPLFRNFWEPLTVGILNSAADEGAAELLWTVLRETLGRGEAACRPRMARQGLSQSFVDPALSTVEGGGGRIRFGSRLRSLAVEGDRVTGLEFNGATVAVGEEDSVVLALPPRETGALVPEIETPRRSRAIVNVHFRLEGERRDPTLLGLVGGDSQWLFARGDTASVTVSAADTLVEEAGEDIARRLWPEVARALGNQGMEQPPSRIIKEKRATFAQTPEEIERRPGTRTARNNLFLAGDWTATGLPATIEGAVLSGHAAAEIVASCSSNT